MICLINGPHQQRCMATGKVYLSVDGKVRARARVCVSDCAHLCLSTEERNNRGFRLTLPSADEQKKAFIHFKVQNKHQLAVGEMQMKDANSVPLSCCLYKSSHLNLQL